MKYVKTTLATLFVSGAAIALYGCMTRSHEREMNHLASALTKVSASVDAKVRFEDFPENVPPDDILKAVAKDDLELMRNFDNRVLRVLREGDASAVMLCESGPGRPLLEDAGCTAKLDAHRWSAPGAQRCEFTLNLKTVCAE